MTAEKKDKAAGRVLLPDYVVPVSRDPRPLSHEYGMIGAVHFL